MDKPELHQTTGGVVDKDQQSARLTAIFEQAMVIAIHRDQSTVRMKFAAFIVFRE